MEAFAQFASDLDASTQRLLQRGQRLTQLLKQPQYKPLPVEEQVCSIYAGTRGYLDKVPVNKVGDFEQRMLAELRETQGDLLEGIRTQKDLTEELEGKLKSFLENFAKTYTAD
jgi:F-type H+-transporting ATPase subunit alpha